MDKSKFTYNNSKSFDEFDENNSFQIIDFYNFWRRRKKIISVTWLASFIFLIFILSFQRIFTPIYKGYFLLLISDPMDNSQNNRKQSMSTEIMDLAKNVTNKTDIPTLMELLKSEYILNPVASQFNLKVSKLAERISIAIGESDSGLRFNRYKFQAAEGILRVELKTVKPKNDIKLLNKLSERYLETSSEQRRQRLKDGLMFLNEQEPKLQKDLNTLETKLVKFREKNSLLEPISEGISIKENIEILKKRKREFLLSKDLLENVKAEVINDNLSATGFTELVSNNSSIKESGLKVGDLDQSYLKQLLMVEDELAKAKSKYTSNSQYVVGLENRLRSIRPLLKENQLKAVDAAINLNLSKIKNIEEQEKSLEKYFQDQPNLIKDYNFLEQKLLISRNNLSSLVSARENFQLRIAQSSVPWRVIEGPRIYPRPISPGIKTGLIRALLISTFLGFILGFLREKMDYVYHSIDEIKAKLKFPILGNLPFIKSFTGIRENKKDLINLFQLLEKQELDKETEKQIKIDKFIYQESFRSIFSSIRFLNADKEIKVITVSSSLPSEGKSLITTLLSSTLSQLGKKVLLIDADFRKPEIHLRCGLNNLLGLSNLLTESKSDFKNYIQKVDGEVNLNVITAGINPPDPSALLSSEKMKSFIISLKNDSNYDYIIFDTPPVIGLADTSILSQTLDGIILITTLNKVNKNVLNFSIETLQKAKVNILGLIVNSPLIDKSNQNGYGYGYGYGYGENDKESLLNNYLDLPQDENDLENNKIKEKSKFISKIKNKFLTLSNRLIDWLDK